MTSKLIRVSAFEAENEFALSLAAAFNRLEPQLRPPFQLTVPSSADYIQMNSAIVCGLLSEPHMAKVHIKLLHAIVTDGYSLFVNLLTKVVTELYLKLLDSVKVQLIWIASEMVDVLAVGVDNLLVSLLRRIGVGDFSDGNVWLCLQLVNLFTAKWDCLLEEEPSILSGALYKFLRLLADHYRLLSNTKWVVLKQLEIEFCMRIFTEQFHLCLRIGRDLVRLLQDLVNIPEFYLIWKKLVLNPKEFKTAGFSDISQLNCLKTSSYYCLLPITPEMETEMRFLLTHVKLGWQKRHQAWFARKFFSLPESETLICDIVRFICCCHHPPNDIIQSDVVPRWAFIGWLLTCCKKNYIEASVKLALFYDWLFFNERVDNIMNIEPAILLMVNSLPSYIAITHTLLEFLFLLVENYDVDRIGMIGQCVSSAFDVLVRKGVIPSLEILISSKVLSPVLKSKLAKFQFATQSVVCKEPTKDKQAFLHGELVVPSMECNAKSTSQFADASVPTLNSLTIFHTGESIDHLIQNLGETYRKSSRMGLKILEKALFSFINFFNNGQEINGVLNPEHLSLKIANEFESKGFKLFDASESLSHEPGHDDRICSPTAMLVCAFIFSQHRRMQDLLLFWSKNHLPVQAHILSYAIKLACEADMLVCLETLTGKNYLPEVNDLRMPFLKFHINAYASFMSCESPMVDKNFVSELVGNSFAAYRCFLLYSNSLLHQAGDSSPKKLFISDMMLCSRWEEKRSKFLFSSVFYHLSDLSIGEEEIIRLSVNRLDHADILAIQLDVGLKKYSIFGDNSETIYNIIKSSLSWGSVEQHKLWALIKSELVVSNVQPEKLLLEFFFSDSLDLNMTSIAAGGFLTLCTCLPPTPELVGAVMILPSTMCKDFSAALLISWVASNATTLFNSLINFFEKFQSKDGQFPIGLGGLRINEFALLELFNYLDRIGMKGVSILNGSSKNILDTISRLRVVGNGK